MDFLNNNNKGKISDRVVYGVILDADIGYGLKYKDENNLYLKLDIQQFDNFECMNSVKMLWISPGREERILHLLKTR